MPNLIAEILARLNIDALKPMQEAALVAIARHTDVVLRAPTGSGKTLAFLLPILKELEPDIPNTQALIIVPSRELAQQIESVWRRMGTGFKVTTCTGGHKREIEENNLVQPPALIIGTPGRLADHIRRGNITTGSITAVVLDEFDKSLELGFEEEMREAMLALTGIRRRVLTSATEGVSIPGFVGLGEDAARLDYPGDKPEEGLGLALQLYRTADKDKLEDLYRLLCSIGPRPSIIFLNHRESVARTAAAMSERGIIAVHYHGAMEQEEREGALAKFRNGSAHFLITTDLAARGLDIAHIRYIIHYHLPVDEQTFTHRNGRTARMEASGTAILMVGPEEKIPAFIDEASLTEVTLPPRAEPPEKPAWVTLYISAGKKDKVNKVDIVGFLTNVAGQKPEDIGLIEVKDFFAYAAVRRSRAGQILEAIKGEKLKGKKLRISLAR